MKISIVTNAFNQGRFLPRCLDSVLGQSGVDLEYIVIDPGSTDDTASILADYEARDDARLVIVREPDNGPADGLNKGFERATGDWFIYLNADDFFLPDALAKGAAAIAANPKADCLYGDGFMTDINGTPTRRVLSTPFTAKKFVQGQALVLQQSTFYKADSFRAVGGFNVGNKTSWDAEILVDMSLAGMELVHVAEYWSAFVIHGDSITGSQRHAAESKKNHERIFEKVMGRPRSEADLKQAKLRRMLDRVLAPKVTLVRLQDRFFKNHLPNITAGLPALRPS